MAVTWDPSAKGANITLSNGNLTAAPAAFSWQQVRATEGKSSGKWYWEVSIAVASAYPAVPGVLNSGMTVPTNDYFPGSPRGAGMASGFSYVDNGYIEIDRWVKSETATLTWANGNVAMFAIDVPNDRIWVGKNGVWLNSVDPSSASGFWVSSANGTLYAAVGLYGNIGSATLRAKSADFSYTPPSGFLPYESDPTQNLSAGLFSDTPDTFTATILTGTVTLSAQRHANSNSLAYQHTLLATRTLTASTFVASPAFNTHALQVGSVSLASALFVSSPTFNTHIATPGSVTLSPSHFPDTPDQFFFPINIGQGQLIDWQTFSNANTFYTHTLTVGSVTVSPDLFESDSTFFAHDIMTQTILSASLYSDDDAFGVADVSQIIAPDAFAQATIFYTHALQFSQITLSPQTLVNLNSFYGQSITTSILLSAALYQDDDTFYGQMISTTVGISAALFEDDDTFYDATVTDLSGGQVIAPDTFDNSATFFAHELQFSTVQITAFPFVNSDAFFGHNITLTKFDQTLQVPLFENTTMFRRPSVSSGKRLPAPRSGSSVRDARPSTRYARGNYARKTNR